MKKIKHILEFTAIIILLPILALIPYRLRIIIGEYLGLLVYYTYNKRKVIAFENIRKSFPERNNNWHKKICKKSFRHFGISAMEFIQLLTLNDKFIDKYFSVEGEEYIAQALSKGKGLIGIGPHLGNWEYLAAYLGNKGFPLSAIVKRQSNPYINILIERFRKSSKIELIYKSKSGFAVIRGIKKNRIIGFVADQDAGSKGVFVNFLGRPASTAQGPARFALSCQSPAIIFNGIREEKGKFRIIISPILEFDYNKQNESKSILYNTEQWTGKVEEYIRKYPEQYFWVHNRWKTKIS